ncbi:MAG: large conductance mechanosensitive channel protein MscL [bacterium]
MKDFIKEFKQFISKGNVLDLAIGVVIGGAFGKIVTSLVTDVITPIIGMIIGGVRFNSLRLGQVTIGNFIQATIDFLIISFVIFIVVKAINKFKKEEKAEEKIPNQEKLLMEIRDLLNK